MQKAFSLQPHEQQQVQQLEEEHRNLLAEYGRITLTGQQIRKVLPGLEEKQRALLRSVVARNGVMQFNTARFDGANVIVDVPDAPLAEPVAALPAARPNGMEPLTERN
jgi:hypothetical protein